ncbi:MAG: L-2-hydroxyglutarate oxidase [Planctomycetota bacterium]|jgi:L-2-hydroxyglutarate oxidase
MRDLLVIGGGILGLACALRYLDRYPGRSVLILEKEPDLAGHQTGHNSGVLHSGIYYPPGSQKAKNCLLGKALLERFCSEFGVPYRSCGKLIVATDESELQRLQDLRTRGLASGVGLEELDQTGIRRLEEHVGGISALHIPGTGIVDYGLVARAFAEQIVLAGGGIEIDAEATQLVATDKSVRVVTQNGKEWSARNGIVCCGLQADRLANMAEIKLPVRIVPFLGEYRRLKPKYAARVQRLIYPVPDPRFPFLGVHLTPRIGGAVDCGPNALPTMAREGYGKFSMNRRDAWSNLSWPGFWRLGLRHFPTAGGELRRSISSRAFAQDLQKLLPGAEWDWFEDAPSGVRAQALDRQGRLVDDYLIRRQGPLLHLINAPSPAATSCLAIAEHLLDELAKASKAS